MSTFATLSQGRDQVLYLENVNNVTYKHRVADDAINGKVDRFYDKVDAGIDALGSVFGVTTKTVRGNGAPTGTPAIEARTTKQLGSAKPFRIIEATDAITGIDSFTVTNGTVKAELPTRELAEKILKAMEEAAR